ncbi:MAG: hypothetical protein ACK4FG_00265 [Brevundimonas sp.]
MAAQMNTAPRAPETASQPSMVSVGVGILVACCLSAMLVSGLF